MLARRRSGQALLGALIVVGLLAVLAGSLEGLAVQGQVAGSSARDQLTAQGMAELAINVGMRVLRDTVNSTVIPNLQTVQDSRAQGWVTNSGSPCTWSGMVSQLGDMLYHFSPLYPGTVPNQVQTASPPATSSYGRVKVVESGPGGRTYTGEVVVGIESAASPCPSWSDTGVQRSLTFPIGVFAFAWVWGPEGNVIGELTQYTPSQTPGYIVMTYPDCPAYFTPGACHLPTSVQVTLPAGELLWNDPNVNAPSMP
jgi:hypothetical protein